MTRAFEIFNVVLGAALAIGFAIFVEWLRKPRLQIDRETPTFETDQNSEFAKIMHWLAT
jgi:hypothetical protein